MSGSEPQADNEAVEFAHRMFDLARAGDPALADYVSAGVPVELTDPAGNTLLMLAAYHEHADLVVRLLALGAGVDVLNDRGQSPLAGAVFKGAADVVDALVAAGADPDAGTPSALETARFFGRDDLVVRLQRPPAPPR